MLFSRNILQVRANYSFFHTVQCAARISFSRLLSTILRIVENNATLGSCFLSPCFLQLKYLYKVTHLKSFNFALRVIKSVHDFNKNIRENVLPNLQKVNPTFKTFVVQYFFKFSN